MAGKVVRRLLLEITEDGDVSIDGFGWAAVDTDDGERTLWYGGDVPDLVIIGRRDQTDAPQVVATAVWPLDRLEAVLATTCMMARSYAIDPSELEIDVDPEDPYVGTEALGDDGGDE